MCYQFLCTFQCLRGESTTSTTVLRVEGITTGDDGGERAGEGGGSGDQKE